MLETLEQNSRRRRTIRLTLVGDWSDKSPVKIAQLRKTISHEGEGYKRSSGRFSALIEGEFRDLRYFRPEITYKFESNGRIHIFERISTDNREYHGLTGTMLYKRWHHLIGRTRRKNAEFRHAKLQRIRGRVIEEEWSSFTKFRDWALANGYDEANNRTTLSRRDMKLGFTKDNCFWSNDKIDSTAKRHTLLTFKGKTMSMAEWAKKLGMSKQSLFARIKQRGWSTEKALTTPVDNGGRSRR